jgi:DDE superfamily endonuclease
VDRRLYLPRSWADDAERRKRTYVPPDVPFQECWRIGLALLDRAGRRCWPCSFWNWRKAGWGEKIPALTVSQIREIFSCLLLPNPPPNSVIAEQVSRVLRRNEDARIYHWYTKTGSFPPLRRSYDPHQTCTLAGNCCTPSTVGCVDTCERGAGWTLRSGLNRTGSSPLASKHVNGAHFVRPVHSAPRAHLAAG